VNNGKISKENTKEKTNAKAIASWRDIKNVWLEDLGYSQSYFAELLVEASGDGFKKTTMQTKLSEVLSGKRAMSADLAVLISKVLKTNPKMWMNLQVQLDIWESEEKAA
jgi:addiction module HigA family antidote